MEISSLQYLIMTPPPPLCRSQYSRQKSNAVFKCCGERFAAPIVQSLSRRPIFYLGLVQYVSYSNPVLSAQLPEMQGPDIIRTTTLPNGVRLQDVVEGDGAIASEGDIVVFNYVCRRSNGYFVYSTVDQFSGEAMPVTLPLDDNQIIEGLKDVLVGMQVGGKRRALIPPSVGYLNENLKPIPDEYGPRRSLLSHAQEPLVFEVQLLKIL